MPSISVVWKSMPAMKPTTCLPTWLPGISRSMPTTSSEATAPMIVKPIDEGSFRTRWLK